MVLFGKKLAEAKIWLKPNMETLQRTANRGSVSTGFNIDNSCKFEADNSEKLSRSQTTGTNRKKFTVSFWVKRTELSALQVLAIAEASGNDISFLNFEADDVLRFRDTGGASDQCILETNRKFRDTSAWYHIVLRVDTTDGTADDRNRIYVNGVQETSFSARTNFTQNDDSFWGAGSSNLTWGNALGEANYYSGYTAEAVYVDGLSLAPTSFGEFDEDSGIWKPIDVSGLTFGNNGYYLDFEDSSNMGNDASGGTDFTETNIAAADQSTDTPTNSFCTLNTLSYNHPITLTEGNTKYVKSDSTYGMISGTHYVGAGKWYWEVKATDFGTYSACNFGILDAAKTTVAADEYGYEDPSLAATNPEILAMSGAPNNWVMNSNATITNNGAMSSVDYTFNEGDILAIALDMDNGAFWFGNSRYSGVANGSFWVAPGGTSTSGSVATTDPANGNYALVGDGGGTNNGTPNFNGGTITGGSLLTAGFTLVTPLIGAYHDGVSVTLEANFGGYNSYAEDGGYADANGHGNFAYAVPSGFYAICTKNIAEFGGSG